MKNKILIAVLSVMVLGSAGFVSAQTLTDAQRLALIAQIQQEIAVLTQEIQQMLVAQQQGTQTQGGVWCYNFNNDIGYGSLNQNDVDELHQVFQRLGISYSPDYYNVYSYGTSQAVMQFQSKYGINPQTGYVGVETRARLNQLYGCPTNPTAVQSCTPSWQIGSWGACVNNQQTRTVTDSKNCWTPTSMPSSVQACVTPASVDINVNGNNGPVNIFLALGGGATVNNSGFTLSENVNLNWNGTNVSSCVASDSMNPTIFSGYVPTSGSQSVNLTGNISGAANVNSKVSDTFKVTCLSTTNASQVSDDVVVNLFYKVNGNCVPSWQCSGWTMCSGSKQTQTCTDYNGCGSLVGEPALSQSCAMPPTANIKANNSDGPIAVTVGSSVNLSWTSSNVTYCQASGDWSGAQNPSGTHAVTMTASTETFTITCTNSGGTATDSVTVNTK